MIRVTRAPALQRVETEEDLEKIEFMDGLAAVEAPAALLDKIAFKNDRRLDSARLAAVEGSIRTRGYVPFDPVIARIGRKGRWVVVDGGHRLTAARRVMRAFWPNLFGPKVRRIYFLLYETPLSRSKMSPRRRKRARRAGS
ncbi:MAG: ParB N-terminal domain-containing protein [Pseudomonadota bacterium]